MLRLRTANGATDKQAEDQLAMILLLLRVHLAVCFLAAVVGGFIFFSAPRFVTVLYVAAYLFFFFRWNGASKASSKMGFIFEHFPFVPVYQLNAQPAISEIKPNRRGRDREREWKVLRSLSTSYLNKSLEQLVN